MSINEFYIVVGVNCLIAIGLFALFALMRLEVRMSQDYIFITYRPFLLKPLMIHKSDVKHWEVREFKPISEYGGIGYRKRKGIKKPDDVSYTIKGKLGLQLELTNGKRILIGTQRRQAIEHAMRKMMEEG